MRKGKRKWAVDTGYIWNCRQEYFLVHSEWSTPEPVSRLVDRDDSKIKGFWYPEDLQEIRKNRILIENLILKATCTNMGKELLVNWNDLPWMINI